MESKRLDNAALAAGISPNYINEMCIRDSQKLMHWQLFQMLLVDQLERFFLRFPRGLQEPLSLIHI